MIAPMARAARVRASRSTSVKHTHHFNHNSSITTFHIQLNTNSTLQFFIQFFSKIGRESAQIRVEISSSMSKNSIEISS